MTSRFSIVTIVLTSLLLMSGCERRAESVTAERSATSTPSTNRTDAPPAPPAADNTASNLGDGTGNTKTPMDQSQSSADVKITAEIRRAIMDDDSMSMNAQNCKIITDKSGVVTLRGVVSSQAEKDSVEAMAKAVVGVTRVDNQLEIKA